MGFTNSRHVIEGFQNPTGKTGNYNIACDEQ